MSRHADIRDAYENASGPVPPEVGAADEMRPYVNFYAPVDRRMRILDAGCGTGSWSRYLVERGYVNVDAVDLFNTRDIFGARYTVSSIDGLPFDDLTFGFCMSLSVIYYLEDPRKAFAEIYRVIRPGSIFLLTAHTRYSAFSILRYIRLALGANSAAHLRHSHFESVAVYRQHLTSVGFEIVKIDGYRLVLHSLYNRIVRSFGINRVTPGPAMTRGRLMRFYKSWFAYHAIIVARRP